MSANNVLVVGGAGFIGSHTAKLLAGQGYAPVVYDNLSTGINPPSGGATLSRATFLTRRVWSRQWKNMRRSR